MENGMDVRDGLLWVVARASMLSWPSSSMVAATEVMRARAQTDFFAIQVTLVIGVYAVFHRVDYGVNCHFLWGLFPIHQHQPSLLFLNSFCQFWQGQ
jgi:hypothetical protein